MPLYKFKVYFEDNEDVYRVIEIKPGQTFTHFHDVILQSIGFDNQHDASFYMSDDMWRKGEEISKLKKGENVVMKDAKLNAFINDPHQKILFVYDGQWWFNCELAGIVMTENPATDYPSVFKSVGKAPKQYAAKDKKFGEGLEEDEFEYIARNLLAGDVSEEELKEHEGFGDATDDEDSDSEDDDMVDDDLSLLDED
jgi:hypothetical protein